MSIPHVPAGHNAVSPYLVVHDARGLIEFLKQTFDAQGVQILEGPGGKIAHSELRIGDSVVMIGEAMPGGETSTGQIHVYVPDVDAAYARALRAGATSMRAPADAFYGDRIGMVKDAFGIRWAMATHKEDVSLQEMERRIAAQMAAGQAGTKKA